MGDLVQVSFLRAQYRIVVWGEAVTDVELRPFVSADYTAWDQSAPTTTTTSPYAKPATMTTISPAGGTTSARVGTEPLGE